MEGERKANMAGGKTPLNVGQSIVFSRPDLTDFPVSTMPINNVVDSLARTLNLSLSTMPINMWQIQQALHLQLMGFICNDTAASSSRNASTTFSIRMLLLCHLVT
jgi:hypothetical protein